MGYQIVKKNRFGKKERSRQNSRSVLFDLQKAKYSIINEKESEESHAGTIYFIRRQQTAHCSLGNHQERGKAIMQISHGMIEYIKRYSHFANYLNQAGILVIGNDHKGTRADSRKDEDLGYFGEEKSAAVIEDLHEVTRYAKEQYGADVPYFLFGHSMGSFMARRYLMTYGEELTRGNYLRDRLHAGGSFDGRKTLCGCDQ